MIFFSSIGFALFLYSGNTQSKVNRAWLVASSAIALWGLSLYGVTSSIDESDALRWQYLLDISAIFVPVLYFNFISTLLDTKNALFRKISLLLAFGLSTFSFSPLFKFGVAIKYGVHWIDPGPYYTVFPIFFTLYTIFALYILVRAYKNNADNLLFRAQIRNTFLGGLIGFGGGLTNFFPQLFNVYPFGNYFVLLYVFFMSYGVLKYKLLSTKIISAQLFSGAMVLVFLFNLLQPTDLQNWIVKFLLFILVAFFSVLLVRGVYKEIEVREKIEELAKNLEKTNKDLEAANVRLQELDQLKSEFVSLATHQIRGPLTAIKGYASLIVEGDYGKISVSVKEAVNTILHAAQSLVVVVGDFLDVSRIEQGRMKYDLKIFDLKGLVQEVINELKPNLDRNKLDLSVTIDQNTEFLVDADRVKIKQVIANIFDNSIKYTPKGSIAISLTKTAGKILFAIKDTGIGIHKDTIPKLFAKFSRAKDANETNIIGTGLGLYLAKELIKGHNGRIWAESEGQGKGSQFYIELNEAEG